MKSQINRRDFLKLGMLAFGNLAFRSYFKPDEQPNPDLWGRVTIEENDVYSEPRSEVPLNVGKRYRDQLVALYYAMDAPEDPAYNPVWYRVWGGYVHSAYLQLVKERFNPVLDTIIEGGQLCEVTVPYTDALRYDRYQGWQEQYRLYYETTHWVTGLAFHGAYWHNNFGAQMSRGCVNMRPADAKWLFRWSTPVWEVPAEDRFAWDRRGYGTQVRVF